VVRAEIQEDGQEQCRTDLEAVEKLVETDSFAIRVKETGYIQYCDPHTLLTLAEENDLIINLKTRPGHFVWVKRPLPWFGLPLKSTSSWRSKFSWPSAWEIRGRPPRMLPTP
jgi:uncharacterized membrane protein